MDSNELRRFERKVARLDSGCHVWTGATASGYGRLRVRRAGHWLVGIAHRLSYEHHVGPIPAGLDLDHLCRNRACVNPAHLEPLTRRANLLRGETSPAANVLKTHCPRGHAYFGANLIVSPEGKRSCKSCRKAYDRHRKDRNRAGVAA